LGLDEQRPVPLDDVVRLQMEAQRRSNTKPELILRRALHRLGLRFRVGLSVPGLPRRTMDIAFTRQRVAVFVDGCFWHGCPVHGVAPKNNAEWWAQKLSANKLRDDDTTQHLQASDWRVVRVWEHQPVDEQVRAVLQALRLPELRS